MPEMEARSVALAGGGTLRYLLALPPGCGDASATERWPLLLFLHGSGERGDDLGKLLSYGPPRRIAEGQKYPCIVAAPQCPTDSRWVLADLICLLDVLADEYAVDADRVYVTGVSMGGFGTWALGIEQPERFAALTLICGGGDTERAAALRSVPIWAFHGALDDVVPPQASVEMVDAVKAAGGSAWLTMYPDEGHESWVPAYNDPRLLAWLLAQCRGQPAVPPEGEE